MRDAPGEPDGAAPGAKFQPPVARLERLFQKADGVLGEPGFLWVTPFVEYDRHPVPNVPRRPVRE